jgi:subtilisin family serine protease
MKISQPISQSYVQLEKRTQPEIINSGNFSPGGDFPFYPPHALTGVDKLHAQGVLGKGIIIGVLDTGVDYTHPALGGCFGQGCKIGGGTDLVGDAYNGTNNPQPGKITC